MVLHHYDAHVAGLAEGIVGIDLNVEEQLSLVREIGPWSGEFDFPDDKDPTGRKRYYKRNGYFQDGDGFALFAMLKRLKPKKVIEIGSGFSSALMLDTCDKLGLKTILGFVEPYPDRLNMLLRESDRKRCILVQAPVQSVKKDAFKLLGPGDILFIDSSHVSKAMSDVNFLFFEILPLLQKGVWIHIHDIFWPFEYPKEFHQEGRAWNECYLLRALLMNNPVFRIRLFLTFLSANHRNLLISHCPHNARDGGVSIWLEKVA
ncbi:MAG: class I SAM-dependent methyltransferase [Opitutaceae bacterium]|nr:class I SAM-dependent methyltransferase [Opitutaceae bacterium]